MRNLRLAENYSFLFLGIEAKKKFGSEEQAEDSKGNLLFSLEILLIDPMEGGEKAEVIKVNIPHILEGWIAGEEIFLDQVTVSLYKLENGRSGLTWKATQAGTYNEVFWEEFEEEGNQNED